VLPAFTYHPDPVATGNIEPGDKPCQCCGQSRGYVYLASVYSVDDLDEGICPWCIANGAAAKKFDATFSDSRPLELAGIPEQIIEEVTRRTPGYVSWQQDVWLVCCRDACEFHGDAPQVEVRSLSGEPLHELLTEIEWSAFEWNGFIEGYEPGGDPAVYKFICRHCKRHHYGLDCS